MPISSINPYSLEVLQEFIEFNDHQIDQALKDGQMAFREWSKTSFSYRRELMLKCADVLEQNIDKLSKIITLEMGKIISESRAEINKCAWVCRYYADRAESFLKDEKLDVEEADSFLVYDPLGIILAVMPWNFPFWQVFRFAAPGLMSGNVGVLKHASNVPQCALAIQEVFEEAGFPEGAFQTLLIGSDKVSRIIDDPRIKAVTLTGSDIAGRKVAERAGKNLKKLVLELGGSYPFIVLKDADIENAVDTAVKARMINCGQSCIAAKRFILEEPIFDGFIDRFEKAFNALKGGDPLLEQVDFGPMAREDLVAEIDHQVEASVSLGAKILTGGGRPTIKGSFYEPTILTNVKPGMPGFDEELFGPVASVISARDAMDAVNIANNSRFGLGASLWTQDREQAWQLARKIETGAVFVNAMVASHPKVPFGGIKDSGYGRELSYLGIREFMNAKSIWVSR
jgi:succinate-semialdehyde dehydrogenase/glutarate-semialdehyde dehydrogenase